MNFTKTLLTLIAPLGITLASSAEAQTPSRYIPYKGVLERDGAPVTATLSLAFDVWGAQTGGSPLFSQTRNVEVTGGNFAVRIGPVPETVFTSTDLYLSVTVAGVPLGGRQLVQTSPYALRGQPGLPFKADVFALSANTGADLELRSGAASLGDRTLEIVANRVALSTGRDTVSIAATSNGGQPALSVPRVVATDDVVLQGDAGISSAKLGAQVLFTNATFNASDSTGNTPWTDPGGTAVFIASAVSGCDPTTVLVGIGDLTLEVLVDNVVVATSRSFCRTNEPPSALPTIVGVLSRASFPTSGNRTVSMRLVSANPASMTPNGERASLSVLMLPTP